MERDGCRKSSPASPSATSSSTAGRGRDPAELRGTAMAGRRRRMPARARSGRARSRVALEADPRARRRRRHCWSFMDVRTHRVPPLHPDLVAASEQGNGREGAPRRVRHRHGGPCLAGFVGRLVGHLTSPPGDRDRCGLARPATGRILLLCFRVSPTTRRSVSRRRSYFGAAHRISTPARRLPRRHGGPSSHSRRCTEQGALPPSHVAAWPNRRLALAPPTPRSSAGADPPGEAGEDERTWEGGGGRYDGPAGGEGE
jgi:hypothetical protein